MSMQKAHSLQWDFFFLELYDMIVWKKRDNFIYAMEMIDSLKGGIYL